MEKILVIEDDRATRKALQQLFETEGFAVEAAFVAGGEVHVMVHPGRAWVDGILTRLAGAAAALSGCIMMLVAFASGSLVGALMDGTVLPMVLGVGGWSVAVAAVAWGWIPRLGRA